jgi:hypothetical protein
MSKRELADRRARVGIGLKVDQCDYCIMEDHGRCYRVICRCQHEGWTRDVNAQVPHGMSAGGSKEWKFYTDTDGLEGTSKVNAKQRNKKNKNRLASYQYPRMP